MKRRDVSQFVLCLGAFALLSGPSSAIAASLEVSSCGEVVSGGGYLSSDLDCSGFGAAPAITIVRGKLELRGFTLTGGAQDAVHCLRSCKIVGPGTITGSGQMGVRAESRATVEDATVSGNASVGIKGFSAVKVAGTDASGNGSCGVSGNRIRMKNSTANDNGLRGVCTAQLRMQDSIVTGNAADGVFSTYRPRIKDSLISGNGLAVSCPAGSDPCHFGPPFVDLRACDSTPRLSASTCETSGTCETGVSSWGVCALD